jgi:selenocysteine lyase/cysteine desulfurase
MSGPTDSTPTPLRCQRDAFDLPADETWLNSAYMGPLPRAVHAAGIAALARRSTPSLIAARDFFDPAERVRGLCARLVGADAENVAFVPGVAYAMGIVARNLAPRPGQHVVVLGDQFPSNVYPWRAWPGVPMRTVHAPMPPSTDARRLRERAQAWNDALVAAIDADTALVAVEQAHWTDGTLFDLERVGTRCREVGAAFVVDATQTVGAMPLDTAAIRPDALVVHGYKSMLSNYGLGFVVFGERFADGVPLEEHWMMRERADDFARLVDYADAYAPGMRRYDTNLRASPVMIDMLGAACELLLEWQPGRIREYLLGIARAPVERLRRASFGVLDEDRRAANLFGVVLPEGMQPESVREALAAKRIHVSVRGASVRVAPHVYNDEGDLHRLVDALIQLRTISQAA